MKGILVLFWFCFFFHHKIWNSVCWCLSLGDCRVKQICLDYNNYLSDNAALH